MSTTTTTTTITVTHCVNYTGWDGSPRSWWSIRFTGPATEKVKVPAELMKEALQHYTIVESADMAPYNRPRTDIAFWDARDHDGELHVQVDQKEGLNHYWMVLFADKTSASEDLKSAVDFIHDPHTVYKSA